MSLADVLIALVIGLTGLVATVVSIDSTREPEQQAPSTGPRPAHIGQKELERMQSLPYGSVLLDSAPATSTDPNDPGYYVTAGSPPTYRWDQRTGGSTATEPLAIATGGVCTPGPCLQRRSDDVVRRQAERKDLSIRHLGRTTPHAAPPARAPRTSSG